MAKTIIKQIKLVVEIHPDAMALSTQLTEATNIGFECLESRTWRWNCEEQISCCLLVCHPFLSLSSEFLSHLGSPGPFTHMPWWSIRDYSFHQRNVAFQWCMLQREWVKILQSPKWFGYVWVIAKHPKTSHLACCAPQRRSNLQISRCLANVLGVDLAIACDGSVVYHGVHRGSEVSRSRAAAFKVEHPVPQLLTPWVWSLA